jgi:hypothetical protein
MLQSGFVVAMAADIDLASYERPSRIVRRVRRWLIVSRLGSDGEHLTISDTGPLANAPAGAPIGLKPAHTLLGVLLSQDGNGDCVFLLSRQRPQLLQTAGTFFPADGYARVTGCLDELHLRAQGRHAHSRGRRSGQDVRKDVPDPAPDARFALAWHIHAERRPWTGEFIPPGA